MKLLHVADLHLGKVVHGYSLIEEQRHILAQILTTVKERHIDAVLVAGDVYDRSVASEDAVALLDDFLVRLAALSTTVFIISGNHDSGDRLNFGRRFFCHQNIHIAGTYAPALGKVTLMDAAGPVHFYLLPYVTKAAMRHAWPEETMDSYDAAIGAAIDHAGVDFTARNVIVAHQFVAHGATRPQVGGSEVMAASVGTIEAIGSEVFDGFDYVALGHVHRPQWIGRETVRYAGSPLKYSLREADDEKSMVLVTLGEKGAPVVTERIPFHPRRDLRHVTGTLGDLRQQAKGEGDAAEDYLYVTLTDETPLLDAMELVKQFYPNAMKVEFAHRQLRELGDAAGSVTEEKSFHDWVTAFYAQEGGSPPNEEEWAVLLAAAREAGVTE